MGPLPTSPNCQKYCRNVVNVARRANPLPVRDVFTARHDNTGLTIKRRYFPVGCEISPALDTILCFVTPSIAQESKMVGNVEKDPLPAFL